MKLLFIASHKTSLHGMKFLVDEFSARYSTENVFACFNEIEASVDKDEYNILDLDEYKKKSFFGKSNRLLKKIFGETIILTVFEMMLESKISKNVLKTMKPACIVVYCDRMIGFYQAMSKEARKHNIPVVRAPIARVSPALEMRVSCRPDLKVDDTKLNLNWLASKLNPHWVGELDGEKRLFYSAVVSIAGFITKQVSLYPFAGSGSGQYTSLALVGSKSEKDDLEKDVSKPIIVTGMLESWYIYNKSKDKASIKRVITDKYELTNDKIVIYSVPPMAERGLISKDIQIENTKNVINELLDKYGQVLISLHPKCKKEDYDFLTKYNGAYILEEKIREVLCIADLFFGESVSGTIYFSKAIGVETVVLDSNKLLKKIEPFNNSYIESIKYIGQAEEFDVEKPKDVVEIIWRVANGEDCTKLAKEYGC